MLLGLLIVFLFSFSTKSALYQVKHVVHSVSLNKLFNIFTIYFQYDNTQVSSVVLEYSNNSLQVLYI